jgi:hypothetical protein
MKNDRDKQQISILSKQISPNNSNYIVEAYKDATKNPYDYLLLDFMPETDNLIRLRSNIFIQQFPMVTYLERK